MIKLVVLLLVLVPFLSKGSHSVGADITYTSLGSNKYKIQLHFYRDCAGIDPGTQISLKLTAPSCGWTDTNLYSQPIIDLVSIKELTPVCASTTSTCNGGVYTGVQEYLYEGTITLPRTCTDWTISYTGCCRNVTVSDIYNPGYTWMYVYALINNTVTNNSAKFNNPPVPFICVNQPFCYDNSAIDPDGDQLVYSLITPKQDANLTVTYITPLYSVNQPILTQAPPQFATNSGFFCFTPTLTQTGVTAILVREFRSGVLVGAVLRDIQLIVKSCPCGTNLPIELLEYQVTVQDSSIVVRWSTGSETNSDYFMVYLSGTDFQFKPVCKLSAAGNSSTIQNYQYIENNPYKGLNYVRVEETDIDGKTQDLGVKVCYVNRGEFLEQYLYNEIGQKLK